MRKTKSGSGNHAGAKKQDPDIQATDDLMVKLLKIPKKELDEKIAKEHEGPKHQPS